MQKRDIIFKIAYLLILIFSYDFHSKTEINRILIVYQPMGQSPLI